MRSPPLLFISNQKEDTMRSKQFFSDIKYRHALAHTLIHSAKGELYLDLKNQLISTNTKL